MEMVKRESTTLVNKYISLLWILYESASSVAHCIFQLLRQVLFFGDNSFSTAVPSV